MKMKRLMALALAILMLCALTACKKDTPVTTTPPETQETLPPASSPSSIQDIPEIVPEIPTETMPPVLSSDMTGAELRQLYANFMKNYDWSQHNGMRIETTSVDFTYIFADNGFYQDTIRYSEVYENSYIGRYVTQWKNAQWTEYIMGDHGSFAFTDGLQDPPAYPQYWALYNENTTAEYTRTKVKDKIYDLVTFTTRRGEAYDGLTYVLKSGDGTMYSATVSDGTWNVQAMVDGGSPSYEFAHFDPNTCALTLNSDKIIVEILSEPENFSDSDVVICGILYINRETQTIEYMEDLDTGTLVYFLNEDVPTFELPNNVNTDYLDTEDSIYYTAQDKLVDLMRYMQYSPES